MTSEEQNEAIIKALKLQEGAKTILQKILLENKKKCLTNESGCGINKQLPYQKGD